MGGVKRCTAQDCAGFTVDYREFGRTGARVSDVGMGTYYDVAWIATAKLSGSRRNLKQKVAALKRGIELGVNLIDTAEIYESEPLVAEAIRGCRRDTLFIATKAWSTHLRHDELLKAARRSLARLRCDYIDLYQVHWPNRRVPMKETMTAMEELVNQGKIRHIGVSNFSLTQMREAQDALSKSELASNQMEYSLKVRKIERDILPYCEKNGIAMLAYRPIAHGSLADPSGKLADAFNNISQKHGGKTPAQMALNWLINKSRMVFPIPRASRIQRVEEDAGAAGWHLDPEDLSALESARKT